MSKLFSGIDDFNDDIRNWNVENVTNMEEMFSGASACDQPLEQWNVGNVTNMEGMFNHATAFQQTNTKSDDDFSWILPETPALFETLFTNGSISTPGDARNPISTK